MEPGRGGAFVAEDEKFLEIFSQQIALALQNFQATGKSDSQIGATQRAMAAARKRAAAEGARKLEEKRNVLSEELHRFEAKHGAGNAAFTAALGIDRDVAAAAAATPHPPAYAPGHHHSPRHRSIVEALEDTTTDDFGGVVSSPRAAAAERRQTAYRLPRVFTRGVDAEWEETFTKIWNL